MFDIANANKADLRKLARACNIDVDGMNVDGMRAALLAHQATVADMPIEEPETPLATELAPEPATETVVEVPVPEPVAPPVLEVAPPVQIPVPVTRPARLESNGVKQPAVGTICRQIWDYCDTHLSASTMPKAKELRAWGAGRLDDVTMTVQFYRWRKFRGIAGRQ